MTIRYRQVEEAPASVVGGEAAIVTPSDSRLHVLNEVGTRIWELCEGEGLTLDALVERLCSEFEVDAQTAAAEAKVFLERAVSAGLLAKES